MEFDFFKELGMLREVTFKKGEVTLLGTRQTLCPIDFVAEYMLEINESVADTVDMYTALKASIQTDVLKFSKKYEFTFNDYYKWVTDFAVYSGWGIFSWGKLDRDNKAGEVYIDSSPVAELLKGRVKWPCDNNARAYVAGGATLALKTDIDCVEEECLALGAKRCKFVFKPAEKFQGTELTKIQLGR